MCIRDRHNISEFFWKTLFVYSLIQTLKLYSKYRKILNIVVLLFYDYNFQRFNLPLQEFGINTNKKNSFICLLFLNLVPLLGFQGSKIQKLIPGSK